MNANYPKEFLSNYRELLNTCPFNCGRAQASFIGGNYDGIENTLFQFSQNLDFPDFASKAKRVLTEYNKIINYHKLESKGSITTQQYCDLFLQRIYDVAQQKGLDEPQDSIDIKDYFGIQSYKAWRNVFDIFIASRLIDIIVEQEDGSFVFQISGKGTHYIETGGKTGIIKTYLSNANVYHDQSVNIQTNYGQAFTGFTYVSQQLIIHNPLDIIHKLDEMKNILENSNEDQGVKQDSLLTIQTLQNEVKKSKPIFSVIKDSLDVLSKVGTISAYAYGLAKILGIIP
jgi:hypothetical protein